MNRDIEIFFFEILLYIITYNYNYSSLLSNSYSHPKKNYDESNEN